MRSPHTSRRARTRRTRSSCSTRPWLPTVCHSGCCPTTGRRSTRHAAVTWASSWSTSPRWVSRRSRASPTSRPPKARTNASTRPCSDTSTSGRWPARWPNCRPRSTRSTSSTTPSVLTRGCRVGSPPTLHGRPLPKADPPRPKADRPRREPPVAPAFRRPRVQQPADLPVDTVLKRLRHLQAGLRHLPGRRPLRTPPRLGRPRRQRPHHHQSGRRDPHRAHPPDARSDLCRQRQTPGHARQTPGNKCHRSPETSQSRGRCRWASLDSNT
jgi:hypothetical protein